MDEKTLKKVQEGIEDTLEKSLPEIVDKTVDEKIKEIEKASAGDISEIKEQVKSLNHAVKAGDKDAQTAQKQAFVVSVFKDVIHQGVDSEEGFKRVVEANAKDMTEGTANEGAELVFDQFESDVLRVLNDFQIVNDVRLVPLAKGDKVNWPKMTNGITTAFVNEGVAATESEPATAFVTIDISKAMTLTDLSEELLDDTMTVPDLYNLLVEFIGESQAEFLETQILTGTGDIDGILQNGSINTVALAATETAGDIDDDALVEVMTKADKKFKRRTSQVKWYMSQYVYGKILALKTTDGSPLYPELRGANPKLIGYDVVLSDVGFVQDSSEDVADAHLLLFGDLSHYILCRRKGLTMERGYHGDNWKKDIQSLKSSSRYGGESSFPEAFTVLDNWAAS